MFQRQILAICPTRGRPEIADRMIQSFNKTSSITTLKMFIDSDDPCVDQYRTVFDRNKVGYVIGEREPITQIFNSTVKAMPHFEYYHMTNDDFIYHTPGWDVRFVNTLSDYGGGIAYGNDLLQEKNMPTCPVVSRNIIQALGWLQLPGLIHLYGDEAWKYIGQKLNCLYYHPDIIIEHRHWIKDRTLMDQEYTRTNSQQMYEKDRAVFQAWINNGAKEEIEKVRVALYGR